MAASTRSDLRGVLAGLLVFLLALTGAGRGGAVEPGSAADLRLAIPGAVQPICHSGQDAADPTRPARDPNVDCCAACALFAAAVLPIAPDLSRPQAAPLAASRRMAAAPAPGTTRIRSPRQAQAPPLG